MAWICDRTPDTEFPIYTRANVGEVFPEVVMPLTFSLDLGRYERGWRMLWTDDAHILDPTDHEFRIWGCFNGYAYLNYSIIRRAADLSPGTSPEEADRQYFNMGGVELPPYERPDEPGWEERGTLVGAWVQSLLRDPPRVALEADRLAALHIRRGNRGRRPEMTDEALLSDLRRLAWRLELLFYYHLTTSSIVSAAFGALVGGLAEAGLGEEGIELARRAVSGLGTVDSSGPAEGILELARLEGDEYREAFDAFVEEHGYRGANEWELASPSWDLAPESLERVVEQARGADPKPSAAHSRAEALAEIERRVGDAWEELPFWLDVAPFYVSGRERTKTTCMVLVNEQRLHVHELARRLVERGVLERPEDVFLLLIDELEHAVRHGELSPGLSDRAAQLEDLRRRVPPPFVFGEVPPPTDWPLRDESRAASDVSEIRGVAGSSGGATGRARIVLDPRGDTPPAAGEILVAPFTDPGWTPLFVPASGVVVEVGGELSHAVIVARELGIPAVVAVGDACSILRDGDLVEVDGSTGVVRILERAAEPAEVQG